MVILRNKKREFSSMAKCCETCNDIAKVEALLNYFDIEVIYSINLINQEKFT